MRILFVCLGNICRSPTAEAIFKSKLETAQIKAHVDSAGTASYHIGHKPDPRSIQIARSRGYELDHLGRQFIPDDFASFDHIFVMDAKNHRDVLALAKSDSEREKVRFLTDLIDDPDLSEVPDPYHGNEDDFHLVVDLVEAAAESFIKEISQSVFDRLGGEPILRGLVAAFYKKMAELPEAKGIREMHPADLTSSEEKLFMFLSGWLGGPNLYIEKHGHPRLRARHLPFAIGKSERDQWMLCMVHAFDELNIGEPLRSELLYSLLNLADHMRNQKED